MLSLLQAAEFVAFVGQGDVFVGQGEEEVHASLGKTGWRPVTLHVMPTTIDAVRLIPSRADGEDWPRGTRVARH